MKNLQGLLVGLASLSLLTLMMIKFFAQSTTNKPLVVIVTGDHEYSSEGTMPLLAAELEKNYNMRIVGKAKHTHYGDLSSTDVMVIPSAAKHPILRGVDKSFHVSSWLYTVLPDYPAKGSTWLLMGKPVNPNTPTANDQPVASTWRTAAGGKTFMTTLGHPQDFKHEALQRLAINAVHWTLGKPVPNKWAGMIEMDVPYREN